MFRRADGQSFRIPVDNKEVDAQGRAVLGHRLGSYQDEVSHVGVGAPDLGAVEDVAAFGSTCGRLDAGDIRAALRLGYRQRAAQVATGQPW
ncbi:hypothetical protein D3C75_619240 [compost metagenome]